MGILNKIKKKKNESADDATKEKKGKNVRAAKTEKQENQPKEAKVNREALAHHNIFLRPHVSEKSVMHESGNMYTFVVKPQTTKLQVKNAVTAVYGVRPVKIRIINVEGKRQMRGRVLGKRSDWKKALVTLPKGKTISIHEGV